MHTHFHRSVQTRPVTVMTRSATFLAIFARLPLLLLLSGLVFLASCTSPSGLGQSTTTGTPARPPTTAPASPVALFGLHMIDASRGWALAEGGLRLLHTTLGPLHWHDVTPPYSSVIGTHDFFLDSQHAWVTVTPLPASGAPQGSFFMWGTADGGKHWRQSLIRSQGYQIGDLFFLSPQLGWVTVDRIMGGEKTNTIPGLDIFRTQDGGATWRRVSTTTEGHPGPGIQLVTTDGGIVFTSSTHGWLLGGEGILRRDGGTNPMRLYSTQDGGITWQSQDLPLPIPAAQVYSVDLLSASFFNGGVEGIIQVEVSASSGSGLTLYTTQDGGAGWHMTTPAAPGTGPFPTIINFVDMQHGWISADRLYRTNDGGQHWTAFPLPEQARSEGFMQVNFVTQTLGWALSFVSKTKEVHLLQTTDGGQTWMTMRPTVG